jgi:hypothetical protein
VRLLKKTVLIKAVKMVLEAGGIVDRVRESLIDAMKVLGDKRYYTFSLKK